MKKERMSNLFGQIDEKYIVEAMPEEKKAKPRFWRYATPIAACFLLVLMLGVGAWQRGRPQKAELAESTPSKVTLEAAVSESPASQPAAESIASEAPVSSSAASVVSQTTAPESTASAVTSREETAYLLPHWDELSISQQYVELDFGGVRYSTRATELDAAHVGEALSTATLSGYDEYEGKSHTITGAVYSIQKISSQCAVAVRFEDRDEYYVYINPYYQPDTLGDFIEDLNLKENLSFGSIWYSYFDSSKQYYSVEFTCESDGFIWDMLLQQTDVATVDDYDSLWLVDEMGISVNIPLLGYSNISLAVTEEGYLTTNILDTGKAFYIGTEKVESFVNYVKQHCEGRMTYGPQTGEQWVEEAE